MTIVFLNNDFLPETDAAISVTDRGLTLGDGVFDTLLVRDGEVVYGAQHFNRLAQHASVLSITSPLSPNMLMATARKLVDKNDTRSGRYALRTTLTRGTSGRGLAPNDDITPTLIMRLSPAPKVPSPAIHATISKTVRRNKHSPLSRIKSLNYGDNILAAQEVRDKGVDDALLMNTAGHVVCGTMGNLFVEQDGRLFTPPLSDGVLDGIMRKMIIDDLNVSEDSLSRSFILDADAIYLSNSLRGVWAIKSLDGKIFNYAKSKIWSDIQSKKYLYLT